jgi:hypothetical protein
MFVTPFVHNDDAKAKRRPWRKISMGGSHKNRFESARCTKIKRTASLFVEGNHPR